MKLIAVICKPACNLYMCHSLKCRVSVGLLLLSTAVFSQHTLTITLSVPAATFTDTFFVAGTFTNWNPGQQRFSKVNGNYISILENLKPGKHAFKFTKGSWNTVECDAAGKDIPDRELNIYNDTVISCTVVNWKDAAVASPLVHTASANVRLMDSAFFMPALNKHRRIWIYLPPDYNSSRKHYPVMYLHDGQNVFDEAHAPFGEWGVDECMDSLFQKDKPSCIVVAVENGQMDRMSEYNPFWFTWKRDNDTVVFEPKADAYLQDIVTVLKPHIDKKYRTLPGKEHTITAGSSMGGLISYYATIKYPAVFGKAGIFSPAFWTAAGIDSLTAEIAANLTTKYFFYMGGKEGGTYVEDMKRICSMLGKKSSCLIYSVIDPAAEHKEKYWRKWFAEFYCWIVAEGFNVNSNRRH